MKKTCGFTFVEVLIGTTILVVALLSTLGLFTHSLSLPEAGENSTIAIHEAERMLEQICADDYAAIKTTYTTAGVLLETPFAIAGLTGMGTVYANEIVTDGLMRIKVVICYQQKNRIIGEDADFDGTLDAGEDTLVVNGELDSPCQLETVVANK